LIKLKEIKNEIFKKENFYFLIIILLVFSIDRYSKIKIIDNFSETSFYLNNFLNFDLLWNTGIGFGLMSSNSPLFYNLISIIIALVIIFLIIIGIKSDKFDKTVFSVIIGGGLGNFYDRIYYKAVPDFIDLHYNDFHWFTFNVADVFISVGIIIYLVLGVFKKKK
tara:strand:- start:103 stop:597 length:495 start_codon:yes stop_codon:yes gene_type:complete